MLKGQCLCGQVTYTSEQGPLLTFVCHCQHCQRQSGSAFSVNVLVKADTIQITGTLKRYLDTAASSNTLARRFCPDCGTPVLSQSEQQPAWLVLKAGTLDDPQQVQPTTQIWCTRAQPWCPLPEIRIKHLQNFPDKAP